MAIRPLYLKGVPGPIWIVVDDWCGSMIYHIRLSAAHYRSFLRLNNRKKNCNTSQLTHCGYHRVAIKTWTDEMKNFCDENFGPYGYILSLDSCCWFVTENDALLFRLSMVDV